MPTKAQTDRRDRIEAAAYALLAQKGYGSTSMLDIAKAAKASNETLYRWYGNKRGLFLSLVQRNAAALKAQLEDALETDAPPLKTLEQIGPVLLAMLVSERAIALNRAAAADPTGELGAAVTQNGRATIAPLIKAVFDRAKRDGAFPALDADDAVALFLTLLIGDTQIRRAIGGLPELTKAEVDARAARALDLLIKCGQAP